MCERDTGLGSWCARVPLCAAGNSGACAGLPPRILMKKHFAIDLQASRVRTPEFRTIPPRSMKMSFARRFLSAAAVAAMCAFASSGCHSGSQTANSPTAQSAQPAQPSGQAEQPGTAQSSNAAPAQQASQAPARSASTAPRTPAAPPPPAAVDLPAGTDLRVRLDQDLGSKISHAGDSFTATVADPVVVDGQTVIPRGSQAEGTVIDAKPLGRFKGGAALSVRLER